MNKQAFKRYLQTMSWNENQTVGRGARVLASHACLVAAGHVRLTANWSPGCTRFAACPPARSTRLLPLFNSTNRLPQLVDYGDLSYLHRDTYEAALRAELAAAEPFEFTYKRNAPKPQARGACRGLEGHGASRAIGWA